VAENEKVLQAQSETLILGAASEETLSGKYGKEVIAGMAAGFADT
jgi:hypothetical protein